MGDDDDWFGEAADLAATRIAAGYPRAKAAQDDRARPSPIDPNEAAAEFAAVASGAKPMLGAGPNPFGGGTSTTKKTRADYVSDRNKELIVPAYPKGARLEVFDNFGNVRLAKPIELAPDEALKLILDSIKAEKTPQGQRKAASIWLSGITRGISELRRELDAAEDE